MKNPKIQLLLGVALSVLFLYLAMRGVDAKGLGQAVATFNWWYAIPFVALTMLSMWVRAWRWHYLMRPTAVISTRRLFGPLMAGFAVNGLLPARIGEFARAFVLGKRDNLPFSAVFATVVVERIFDTLTLLILLAGVFMVIEIDPSISLPYSTQGEMNRMYVVAGLAFLAVVAGLTWWLMGRKGGREPLRKILVGLAGAAGVGAVMAAIALPPVISYGQEYEISGSTLRQLSGKLAVLVGIMVAGSLMLLWPAARRWGQSIVMKLPLPMRLRELINSFIETFANGLASLRSIKTIVIVLLQSLAIWFIVAWSMQIMPYGFDGMRAMTMSEAVAILVITCLAIIIPAAPGYWGLMELGIKFGMIILAVDSDPNRILAYSLIVHALQYFPITLVGLYALWKEQVKLSDIRQDAPLPASR